MQVRRKQDLCALQFAMTWREETGSFVQPSPLPPPPPPSPPLKAVAACFSRGRDTRFAVLDFAALGFVVVQFPRAWPC